MISVSNLSKRFNKILAVDNLSLEIPSGEIFGLLGENGAGKTTTIRIMTMLENADTGNICINNHCINGDSLFVKKLIGVVPQHFNLDVDLTARENLILHARLHHLAEAERTERANELLKFVDLENRADDMVSKFSGGMKRRLMIARALMHKPSVLFLDEPTVGLDPQVRRKLWDLIRKMNSDNMTVLLTTHYIEEADFLCNRVAIMEKGKILTIDSPENLKANIGKFVVEWYDGETGKYEFFVSREEARNFAASLNTNTTVRHSSLEDVFVELTGKKAEQ